MPEWIVTPSDAHLDVLEWLRRQLPAAPAGYLRQLLRGGRLCRNGQPLAAADRLRAGDCIHLPDSARLLTLLAEEPPAALEVLYEDRQLLAVNKPAGLLVHRAQAADEPTLSDLVAAHCRPQGRFRTAPAHRLDRETSGVVLFGKGRQALGDLGRLFLADRVEKWYLALVHGTPPAGPVTTPVRAKGQMKMAAAVLYPLAEDGRCTLVLVRLHTGRQHQIRQQLAALGTPLVADRRYGGAAVPWRTRPALHSLRLVLHDPARPQPLRLQAPVPADLRADGYRLGLTDTQLDALCRGDIPSDLSR